MLLLMAKPKHTEPPYSDEEADRRMNEALRRALTTPPKPQATVRRPRKAKKAVADRLPKRKPSADADD
jgi:hypothetical protein